MAHLLEPTTSSTVTCRLHQVNQNLGNAIWYPAAQSSLAFEDPWLQLASADAAAQVHFLPRERYTMVGSQEMIYVFGGAQKGAATDHMFAFNTTRRQWLACVPGSRCGGGAAGAARASAWPPARHSHVSVVVKGMLMVLGGVGAQGERLGDMWAYDAVAGTWDRMKLNQVSAHLTLLPSYPYLTHNPSFHVFIPPCSP